MPVVNFKLYGSIYAIKSAYGDDWLYIGRANPRCGLPGSPLANPYRIDDRTDRKTAVELYKQYLWARIKKGETAVLEELQKIGENTAIICWCAPQVCHGDVVVKAAAWLRQQSGGNGRVDGLAMPKVLKAITLWEPWATLMALGLKLFETRSWGTEHRGLLAIHSAKRKVNWRELNSVIIDTLAAHGYTESGHFHYGSILAIGSMTGCYRTPVEYGETAVYGNITMPPSAPEAYFGDYSPGRFAWHVPDAKAIKPVECRGMQQLWTVPEEPSALAWGRYQRAAAVVQEES